MFIFQFGKFETPNFVHGNITAKLKSVFKVMKKKSNFRRADNGRYCTEEYAKRHPKNYCKRDSEEIQLVTHSVKSSIT